MGITVGIVAESAPGERRVAMVPGALGVLNKTGVEWILESGAGLAAGFPDSEYAAKGVRIGAPGGGLRRRRSDPAGAQSRRQSRERRRRSGARSAAARRSSDSASRSPPSTPAASLAARGVSFLAMELMPRITRAQMHGRAFFHGHDCRVQGRADRRRHPAAHVSHADDRGGHGRAGARAGDRRGRGRIAGHRHRAPAGRGGERLRHPRRR